MGVSPAPARKSNGLGSFNPKVIIRRLGVDGEGPVIEAQGIVLLLEGLYLKEISIFLLMDN